MSFKSIPVENFYGGTLPSQNRIEAILDKSPINRKKPEPDFLRGLLGPSLTWRVFSKQVDALQCAKKGCGLMSFAFEQTEGDRAFLTCHPLRLWYNHENWKAEKCTYEIIPEGEPCKLYLDIEFEYDFNSEKNYHSGEEMLEIYLRLMIAILGHEVKLSCTRDDFLDLDSSTSKKFSRHLILNVRAVAFQSNISVGNLVKNLSYMINDHVEKKISLFGITVEDMEKLFVLDRKGNRKMFVDTAVYTRNRHFRLLGSTKKNKNAPLVISKINKYKPRDLRSHSFFLASLVSYFEDKPVSIISYESQNPVTTCSKTGKAIVPTFSAGNSIDNFIFELISPRGKIRQKRVLEREIKYEISGYRYCGNIGREHRSNNISIIVDLIHFVYYQTCYDADCARYRSPSINLPADVIFSWSSEDSEFLVEAADSSLFLQEVWDSPGDVHSEGELENCLEKDLALIADEAESSLLLLNE